MKFDILNSIIYLFMTLFGVHSAKTEVEIPASKKEVLKIFAGVSRLQCIHRCTRHHNCSDVGVGKDRTCLLLSKVSGDAAKSNVWILNGKEVINVERISPVLFPDLSSEKDSQETIRSTQGKEGIKLGAIQ